MIMSERRKINKNHPLYDEYKEKLEAIAAQNLSACKAISPTRGNDNPDSMALHERLVADIIRLQQEYIFLFETPTDDNNTTE